MLPLDAGVSSSLKASDRIFLGEGLFETIRVMRGRPCYSELHWQRIHQSALTLHLPFELSLKAWNEQLTTCIHSKQIEEGGIKVLLAGGPAARGLESLCEASFLSCEGFAYSPNHQALRLVSAPWLRDGKNPIYQFKSVNYLESILARRHALRSRADDALFFNLEGYATETTVANLFLVKQEQIITPMLASGILAGIIRGRLLSLCQEFGIAVTETTIDKKAIETADAVFVTNALQGIRKVVSFDGGSIRVDHPLVTFLQHILATDKKIWPQSSFRQFR